MYGNIDTVLDEAKDWFSENYGEIFQLKRDSTDKFTLYQSESHEFEVTAAFIQARTQDDFQVSIKHRLQSILKEATIEKGKRYRLSSRATDKQPMLIEYCIEQIS